MAQEEFIRTLKDLTAGTIGACAGIATGQPFDTVKVRMQSSHTSLLYKNALDCFIKTIRIEGFRALYKGMSSPLLGNAPLNAIVFGCNGNMNRLLDKYWPRNPNQANKPDYLRIYASASWAGAAQCIVCTPVELIKCKLQVQLTPTAPIPQQPITNSTLSGGAAKAINTATSPQYSGAWDCVRQTYQNKGITGLYRGWWSTFWRDAPSYGVWFVAFEGAKYNLTPEGQSVSTPVLLIAGGLAGIATWSVTYPFDVIKSVVQTLPDNTPNNQLKIYNIASKAYSEHGYKWFFRGIGPTLIRAVPVSAVTFYVYEKCLAGLNKL